MATSGRHWYRFAAQPPDLFVPMKSRRFGDRLHHDVPPWVKPGNFFHLCVRATREQPTPLTEPALAKDLRDSARFYREKGRWRLGLLVLMPDHLHALAAFPRDEDMSLVVGDWKRGRPSSMGCVGRRVFRSPRAGRRKGRAVAGTNGIPARQPGAGRLVCATGGVALANRTMDRGKRFRRIGGYAANRNQWRPEVAIHPGASSGHSILLQTALAE